MEKCHHVSKIRPAWDHSILNPEKWMCYLCKTTESVWACLSCSNVACGRFNEKHALNHYQESKHPISIEVNEKYVYCYTCDDYVFNDNAAGDIKLLRSALSAVATQKFTDIESRGRRLLRSYSHTGIVRRDNTDESDKLATAEWHQRQRLLAKTFLAWRSYVQEEKASKQVPSSEPSALRRTSTVTMTTSMSSIIMLRKSLAPGVTGLRNLGNTCYMNSVLQVLSHIEEFRDFFLKMRYAADLSSNGGPASTAAASSKSSSSSATSLAAMSATTSTSAPNTRSAESTRLNYTRQTTVECFQHLMSGGRPSTPKHKAGGLNGGSAQHSPIRQQLICDVESTATSNASVSLCVELHGLFRVLWSSKWAQVSPHAFLRSVWQAIPMFKGYAQHDAQEFLCELLDKIQGELDAVPKSQQRPEIHLLNNLFQGQLVSQVTCLSCGNVSSRFEPYLDLSLEFPDRYQITKQNPRISQDICHITEMLAKFTEEEHLEGPIYACEKCNKKRRQRLGPVYTEAKKQLLINNLPPVLRLHLKRFRWSGRDHREKISTHVAADEELDLKPFCSRDIGQRSHKYQLFGVIIHHGKGFGSGHYTAYTWNKHADSWVNCNDSRMILSSLDDVLSAQAYILFYRSDIEPQIPAATPVTVITPSSSRSSVMSGERDKPKNANSSSKKQKTKPASDSKVLRRSARRSGKSVRMDQLSMSDLVKRSVPFSDIDKEISFKVSEHVAPTTNSPKRGNLKRSHDKLTTQDGRVPIPSKSAKKLSFGPDVFYGALSNTKQDILAENGDSSKLLREQDSSSIRQTLRKSDINRRVGNSDSSAAGSDKSPGKSVSARDKALKHVTPKQSSDEVMSTGRAHLKRRRTTMW